MEQKQPLQQLVLRDLDSYVQKNETRSPTYAIHKNKLQMDKDLNLSRNTIKVLEENIGRKISDIPRSNILTDTEQTLQKFIVTINDSEQLQQF